MSNKFFQGGETYFREGFASPAPPWLQDGAYQESLLSAAKQCIWRGHCKNYVLYWDKQCKAFYRSFIRAPVGTHSDRTASSLLFLLEQKQKRWEETVIPLTSRTLTARCGAPSTNSLAGLDAPLDCAPSQQTPTPPNLRRTEHNGLGRQTTRLSN